MFGPRHVLPGVDLAVAERTPVAPLHARTALGAPPRAIDDLLALSTPAFEDLIKQLLEALGYCPLDAPPESSAEVTLLVSHDPLGLDRIYISATRHARAARLKRPFVESLAGAVQGQRADAGVLITTGRFAEDVHAFAAGCATRIRLIDGDALADLLAEHDLTP